MREVEGRGLRAPYRQIETGAGGGSGMEYKFAIALPVVGRSRRRERDRVVLSLFLRRSTGRMWSAVASFTRHRFGGIATSLRRRRRTLWYPLHSYRSGGESSSGPSPKRGRDSEVRHKTRHSRTLLHLTQIRMHSAHLHNSPSKAVPRGARHRTPYTSRRAERVLTRIFHTLRRREGK